MKSDNVYLDIQVPVVQTLGSVFQRISHYTADKYILGKNTCVIHWIEIYPADSVIHLLNIQESGLRKTTANAA